MLPHLRIFIPLFLLAACTPATSLPLPTHAPTSTPTPYGTNTAFPMTQLPFFNELFPYIDTVNTPHSTPESGHEMSWEEAEKTSKSRVKQFEQTLRFDLQIADVKLVDSGGSVLKFYVESMGTLTNISKEPVVIRKFLTSGFSIYADVQWQIWQNEKHLNYTEYNLDVFVHPERTLDDFVVLQPDEFQNYQFWFLLPTHIPDTRGSETELSGKNISFVATYVNTAIGYLEGSGFDYSYSDLNAWVGKVTSNPAEYLFP